MELSKQEQQLFNGWKQVFMKSMSTFWILFSLKSKPRKVEEIEEFMASYSQNNFQIDRMSLYRALRKLYESGLVTYEDKHNPSGPNWKIYSLNNRGANLLGEFIAKCIKESLLNPLMLKELDLNLSK
jgi:DNA-binding PadR family transcriptional regulator